MTEQSWTIESLAAKARELLANAQRLKVKYENVRAAGGGRRLATVGRERQLITKELVAVADAYRALRSTPDIAAELAANPAPEEGSDLAVLEKLAADHVRWPEAHSPPVGADRPRSAWMQRKRD